MSSSASRSPKSEAQEEEDLFREERSKYAAASKFLENQTSATSPAMRESLVNLQKTLTCPLCSSVLVQPVTIHCGHTFCCECIDRHADNSWYCPIKGCEYPVALKSSKSESFRTINATTQTVVTSWSNIVHTLMRAEGGWWKCDDNDEEIDYDMYNDNNGESDDENDEDSGEFATAEESDGANF